VLVEAAFPVAVFPWPSTAKHITAVTTKTIKLITRTRVRMGNLLHASFFQIWKIHEYSAGNSIRMRKQKEGLANAGIRTIPKDEVPRGNSPHFSDALLLLPITR
jgi:hypothetical protein